MARIVQAMLAKEKALAVALDELSAERWRMPMMGVDASYRFIGPQGEVGLLDLFEGRRQLMVYRFFYAEDVEGWPDAGCTGLLALRRQRHPSRAPQRPGHHVGLRIGDDPGSHRGLPRADRVGRRRLTELRSARHARVGRAVCEPYPSQLASVALPPRRLTELRSARHPRVGRAGVRALALAAGVRGVAVAIASHCDSETQTRVSYQADRKSFPFGSGIWLPSDYGTQAARRTLTSTTDKAAPPAAATHPNGDTTMKRSRLGTLAAAGAIAAATIMLAAPAASAKPRAY